MSKCVICDSDIIKRGNTKFCSRECYLIDHKAEVVEVECTGCGENFTLTETQRLNKNKGQVKFYCSTECRRNTDYNTCTQCGVKFCSFNYTKNNTVRRHRKKICSKECLSEFYRTDALRKEKISKAFKGENHPMWNGGSSKHHSRGSMWKQKREEVFAGKGNACELCGITREESKVKHGCDLHIDHIIPYHNFKNIDEANKITNLRPLCPSCHAKDGKHSDKGFYTKKVDRKEKIFNHNTVSGKYTVEVLRKIKSEYVGNGVSWSNISELEKRYNVSKHIIRKVVNGTHWACEYL